MGKGLEQRLLKKMKPQQPVSMKSSASLANREMQIKMRDYRIDTKMTKKIFARLAMLNLNELMEELKL